LGCNIAPRFLYCAYDGSNDTFLIEVIRNDAVPLWVGMFGIPVLAGILCLLLLQPIKGLWMGIIWANRIPTS